MTYKEAKAKLAVIAAGRYHSMYYTEATFPNGRVEPECRLYIDPSISSGVFNTWERAFDALDMVMNGTSAAIVEEQRPDGPPPCYDKMLDEGE